MATPSARSARRTVRAPEPTVGAVCKMDALPFLPPDGRTPGVLYVLIAAHAVAGALTPALARWFGSRAFFALALVPLASGIWLLQLMPTITDGATYDAQYSWIPSLGVNLDLHVGLVQWVLAMVVCWIGALVLIYCRWYFDGEMPVRSGSILTIFAGTMLGLVTADDLVLMYVFWELTSVFSYLLIAHDPTRRANRGAANTATIWLSE